MKVTPLLLAVACSSPSPPPTAGSASGSAAPAAPLSKFSKPAGSGSAQLPPEDPAARVAYRKAMAAGRVATDAGQYKEAITAFDQALVAKPADARALAERGFARLLEGANLPAAEADFDRAATHTRDPKLLSMIWFNRGLAAEKRGMREAARVAFHRANELRPSAAAARKLAGRPVCPVLVTRALEIGNETRPIDAADWRALALAMPHADPPATPEAALAHLTGSSVEPALPTSILATDAAETIAYVVWRTGAKLRALPLGYAMGGRCPGELAATIVASVGNRTHVRVEEMGDNHYAFMCKDAQGEHVECSDQPGEEDAGTACLGGSKVVRDVVVDRVAGKLVVATEQPHPAAIAITLAGGGLKLAGGTCDRVER